MLGEYLSWIAQAFKVIMWKVKALSNLKDKWDDFNNHHRLISRRQKLLYQEAEKMTPWFISNSNSVNFIISAYVFHGEKSISRDSSKHDLQTKSYLHSYPPN